MNNQPYILDTNIFVHLIRDDNVGKQIIAGYKLYLIEVTPVFCVVTEGEIRSLAMQWRWGHEKSDKMSFLLSYFTRLPIESTEVLNAYARIDSFCKARGITMGKNDLWIAAIAHVTGFTLLTVDHDFDALHPAFISRELVQLNADESTSSVGDNMPDTEDQ